MLNILLVEDEEPFLKSYAGLLGKIKSEITVFPVTSGEDALVILKQNPIDGSFLDIELPGISGLTLATKIREMEKYHFLPIVLVTGHDYNSPETFKATHCFDYISKPFTEADFMERAKSFIREIRAQRKQIQQRERMLILPTYTGTERVKLTDILYAEKTATREIRIVTFGHVYLRRNTPLEQFLIEIDDEMFTNSSKSCIVNTANISQIIPKSRKTYEIIFSDSARDRVREERCNLSISRHPTVMKLMQRG